MNNDIKTSDILDLERKEISVCENTMFLASQGYIVNRSKHVKLSWLEILKAALNNKDVFNEEQTIKINNLCNKVLSM